jgi:hypothetical protein
MVRRREISLGFSSERCLEGLHVCYIFRDERERRATIAPYLQAGLDAGEKVSYLADATAPGEVISSLVPHGLHSPTHAPTQSGGLQVADARATCCPSGVWLAARALELVRSAYREARSEGYAGVRGTTEMTWTLTDEAVALHETLAYEAMLTELLKQVPFTTCCQYDARRLTGDTIMDVLAVHPLMVVRGQLVHNPYYVEPDQFLAELRGRAEASATAG